MEDDAITIILGELRLHKLIERNVEDDHSYRCCLLCSAVRSWQACFLARLTVLGLRFVDKNWRQLGHFGIIYSLITLTFLASFLFAVPIFGFQTKNIQPS